MIFDLTAARGGRKYLFHNGKCSDVIGSFTPFYDDEVTTMQIGTNGATFTAVGTFSYSQCSVGFSITNQIDFSKFQKIYVEFDAFTLPEGYDANWSSRNGFIVSRNQYGLTAGTDIAKPSSTIAHVPVERSNAPFTVEIDVSGCDESAYLHFYAVVYMFEDDGDGTYTDRSDEAIGTVAKIRSIWYI